MSEIPEMRSRFTLDMDTSEVFMDGTRSYLIRRVGKPGIIGSTKLRLTHELAAELGEVLSSPQPYPDRLVEHYDNPELEAVRRVLVRANILGALSRKSALELLETEIERTS